MNRLRSTVKRPPGILLGGLLITLAISTCAAAPQNGNSENGPLSLSLDQAINLALAQGPAARAVAFQADAAQDKAHAANRSHWGELDAVANYAHFDEDRLMVPMSSQLLAAGLGSAPFDRNQVHYGLTYRIPFYLGGKLSAGIEIAKLDAAKADALREGTRWQIRFNVASLYASIQTLDGGVKASDELIRTLQSVQNRLELMVREGKRPELDLLKVRDELAEAQAGLATLQANRIRAAGLLLVLLGQAPDRPLTVSPLGDEVLEFSVPAQDLSEMALESSAVKQAELSRQQAQSGIKAARSHFLPSIFGQADYFGHHADSVDDDLTSWALSLGVKLPLFDGTSRFAGLSAAKAGERAAEQGLKLARLRRQADLNEALARMKAARTGFEAAQARTAAAAEAARREQLRYDSGASSIEDLLRAKTRVEAANTALAMAKGELRIAAEQINAAVEKEVVR